MVERIGVVRGTVIDQQVLRARKELRGGWFSPYLTDEDASPSSVQQDGEGSTIV